MPLEAMLGVFPDCDAFRKMQPPKNNVVIVDLPAAADHDEHRDGINPMHDPDRQRMKDLLHSKMKSSDETGRGRDGSWSNCPISIDLNSPIHPDPHFLESLDRSTLVI